MAKDIEVSQLIINKLTKEQYDEALDAGNIVDTELYMITDDEDSSAISAILYTAQTLTEDQKAQARANIGVDEAISAAIGTAIGGSY